MDAMMASYRKPDRRAGGSDFLKSGYCKHALHCVVAWDCNGVKLKPLLLREGVLPASNAIFCINLSEVFAGRTVVYQEVLVKLKRTAAVNFTRKKPRGSHGRQLSLRYIQTLFQFLATLPATIETPSAVHRDKLLRHERRARADSESPSMRSDQLQPHPRAGVLEHAVVRASHGAQQRSQPRRCCRRPRAVALSRADPPRTLAVPAAPGPRRPRRRPRPRRPRHPCPPRHHAAHDAPPHPTQLATMCS